jgi:hypothetical protein
MPARPGNARLDIWRLQPPFGAGSYPGDTSGSGSGRAASADRATRLHAAPLPGTDSPQPANSNLLSNTVLGTGSTGFVEGLVRLQAEAAADDLFHDLGGAAEDRRGLAARAHNRAGEQSGLVPRRSRPGSVESARAVAFARCDLDGDHAPRDRLAAP